MIGTVDRSLFKALIARGIEIDLREMIADSGIPGPDQQENGFLM